MAISTYSELQTAGANWLARDDLTDRIPEFITLAEAKFNRDLRCPQMEKRSYATVNLSADEPEYITLPSNFQTMRRICLSGVTGKPLLEFVSPQQANQLRFEYQGVSGQPYYFTIIGDELELIRVPNLAYVLEMVYRANIPALSSVQTTNWLLTLAPDLYLYGLLMEAAPYMKDDARVGTWSQGYGHAIDGLNRLGFEQVVMSGPSAVMLEGPAP